MRLALRALHTGQVRVATDGGTATRAARACKGRIHRPLGGVVIEGQLFVRFDAVQSAQRASVDPAVRCTTVIEETPTAAVQVVCLQDLSEWMQMTIRSHLDAVQRWRCANSSIQFGKCGAGLGRFQRKESHAGGCRMDGHAVVCNRCNGHSWSIMALRVAPCQRVSSVT